MALGVGWIERLQRTHFIALDFITEPSGITCDKVIIIVLARKEFASPFTSPRLLFNNTFKKNKFEKKLEWKHNGTRVIKTQE